MEWVVEVWIGWSCEITVHLSLHAEKTRPSLSTPDGHGIDIIQRELEKMLEKVGRQS